MWQPGPELCRSLRAGLEVGWYLLQHRLCSALLLAATLSRASHPTGSASAALCVTLGESLEKPRAEQAASVVVASRRYQVGLPSACAEMPGPAGRLSDAVHKVLLLMVWQWG